jgi:hypothetical protein
MVSSAGASMRPGGELGVLAEAVESTGKLFRALCGQDGENESSQDDTAWSAEREEEDLERERQPSWVSRALSIVVCECWFEQERRKQWEGGRRGRKGLSGQVDSLERFLSSRYDDGDSEGKLSMLSRRRKRMR